MSGDGSRQKKVGPGAGVETLGGHSLVYALSSLIGQLGTLLTFPLYTRALGAQEYGVLALALSASGVLRTMVIAGTNTALMHERITADPDEVPRITAAAAAWVVAAATAFGLAGAVLVEGAGAQLRTGLDAKLIAAIAVFVGVDSLYELTLAVARAESRPAAYAMANGFRIAATFCVAALLFALTDAQSVGAVFGMATGSAVAGVWLASRLRIRFAFRRSAQWIPRLLKQGFPLVPANLASWIANLSDRYLLLLYLGSTTVVGVYSAGYRIGTLITALFVGPFHTAFLPFMLRNLSTNEDESTYRDASRLFLVIGAVAVSLLQAISVPLVRVLAGSGYAGAERVVGVVALGSLLCGAAMLMTPVAIKAGRSHVVALAFGVGAAVNLALNVWLIPLIGPAGAALATLAGYMGVLAAALLLTPAPSRPPGFVSAVMKIVPLMTLATVPTTIDYGGVLAQTGVCIALSVSAVLALILFRILRLRDLWSVVSSLGSSGIRLVKDALPRHTRVGRVTRQAAYVVKRLPHAVRLLRVARFRSRRRRGETVGPCGETEYLRFLLEHPAALARATADADLLVAGDMITFGKRWCWHSDHDWHLDVHSGRRWTRLPAGFIDVNLVRRDSDVQSPWETSRLEHVWRVAIAYAATGEERYASWVIERLVSWRRANPTGWGVNWTVSMEVALRAIALLEICSCMRTNPTWTEALEKDVSEMLGGHVEWALANLEHYGTGTQNHYLASLVGIFAIDAHLANWDRLHVETEWVYPALMQSIRSQVYDDGVDFENSLGYHLLVCELVGYALGVARSVGREIPSDVEHRLRAMLEFASMMEFEDGTPVAFGDDDDDYLLPSVMRHFDRSRPSAADHLEYSSFVARVEPQDLELATRPPRVFERGGVAVLGGGSMRVIVNAMPTGVNGRGPHRHNDALSFCLEVGGQRVLVDPGTYRYQSDSGQQRHGYRSVTAHSTVQIDGHEQNSFPGLFALDEDRIQMSSLVTNFGELSQRAEAVHNAYVPTTGLRHSRSWEYSPLDDICAVTDVIEPVLESSADEIEHQFVARFVFAPGLVVTEPEPRGDGSWDLHCGVCAFHFVSPAVASLTARLVEAWNSPRYRVEDATTMLEVTWRANARTSLVSTITAVDAHSGLNPLSLRQEETG